MKPDYGKISRPRILSPNTSATFYDIGKTKNETEYLYQGQPLKRVKTFWISNFVVHLLEL